MMRRLLQTIYIVLAVLSAASIASADFFDTLQVLKISPQDETAVVRMPDGTERVIKHSDSVGAAGKMVEVSHNRLVFEERTQKGVVTVIITIEKDGKKINRISRQPEHRPEIYKP